MCVCVYVRVCVTSLVNVSSVGIWSQDKDEWHSLVENFVNH